MPKLQTATLAFLWLGNQIEVSVRRGRRVSFHRIRQNGWSHHRLYRLLMLYAEAWPGDTIWVVDMTNVISNG